MHRFIIAARKLLPGLPTKAGDLPGQNNSSSQSFRQWPTRECDWTDTLRYDYLMANSQSLLAAWRPSDQPAAQIVATLVDSNVVLRTSSPAWMQAEAGNPRLGLTLLVAGRAPLIWINLARHRCHGDVDDELVDTLIHEAMHASASALGRHVRLPDAPASRAYCIEEATAHWGTSQVEQAMGLPGSRRNRKAARGYEATMNKVDRAKAQAAGAAAACWLLDQAPSIIVEPPRPLASAIDDV